MLGSYTKTKLLKQYMLPVICTNIFSSWAAHNKIFLFLKHTILVSLALMSVKVKEMYSTYSIISVNIQALGIQIPN